MAINVEEHTITQSVLALEQPADWKALESFAEYGCWHQDRVTWALTRLITTAPGWIWYGYHVSAVDDTKVHRSSPHVWGTCTFHEYTARCPNRAPTVRAHNWVVLGALLPEPGKPAWFLPISGRLYFRESQLPIGPEGILEFHTKCELAVTLLREQARIVKDKHLAVFDGGYALESVVRPLVLPEEGAPGSNSSPACDVMLGCTPCRHHRSSVPMGSGDRNPNGVSGWSRPTEAVCGMRPGRSGPRSSTAGSERYVGRRSSACGGSWAGRCRSRR